MDKYLPILLKGALSLTLVAVLFANAVAGSAPKMTKEELKPMLGDPDVVILDVRIGRDWKASEYKIEGAVRADYREVESVASRYGKDKTFVLYCA